jgi:hypothetical protein
LEYDRRIAKSSPNVEKDIHSTGSVMGHPKEKLREVGEMRRRLLIGNRISNVLPTALHTTAEEKVPRLTLFDNGVMARRNRLESPFMAVPV